MTILSYFELPDDDRPPERIWLDDEALEHHFEKVQEQRRNPRDSGMEDIPESGPLDQNELTRDFKRE